MAMTLRTRTNRPSPPQKKKRPIEKKKKTKRPIEKKKKKKTRRTKQQQKKRASKRPLTDRDLRQRYRDPTQPGSLGGVARFAKTQGISAERASKLLAKELGYTLHKPARRRFPTLRVLVFGPDEQWAADLVDVQKLARQNKGVKYLLTVIDVFSKYAWVVPLKQKTGPLVAAALKGILRGKRTPKTFQTDKGKEFYNKHVTKTLKEDSIRHFSTSGDTKANVVERFNRTFKQRLYRFMTSYNTATYLPVLQSLVKGYNASWHRSIGMAPRDVNQDNAREVWERLYGKTKKKTKRGRDAFRVGDRVRLNKKHRPFQKGYLPGWTEEVFLVTDVRRDGNVTVYRISEWDDTPIKGTFYKEDLQKVTVSHDDLFRIESVVRRKKDRVLVRWQGWPAKYDSWVSKKDLIPLSKT